MSMQNLQHLVKSVSYVPLKVSTYLYRHKHMTFFSFFVCFIEVLVNYEMRNVLSSLALTFSDIFPTLIYKGRGVV